MADRTMPTRRGSTPEDEGRRLAADTAPDELESERTRLAHILNDHETGMHPLSARDRRRYHAQLRAVEDRISELTGRQQQHLIDNVDQSEG